VFLQADVGLSDDARSVRKRHFLSHLYVNAIFLPRQIRDKHWENSKKATAGRRHAQSALLALSDKELQVNPREEGQKHVMLSCESPPSPSSSHHHHHHHHHYRHL
jgi:hypothetical protein